MSSSQIIDLFRQNFTHQPWIVRSPGRVNLIGEHTDYNDGFVLPASIDKGITFAIAPNSSSSINLISHDLKDSCTILNDQIQPVDKTWANYLLGVVAQFHEKGMNIPGFDCVFGGNIPVGAGLSSSAALECGLALGLNEIFSLGFSKMDLVKMAQKAEHTYAGVQCGIMDQFASVFGKKNHVVKLDCRSLDYEYFPVKMADHCLLLCNTKVSHSLASSEYNTRRIECEKGVRILQGHLPEIESLRDVTKDMLQTYKDEFEPIVYKRCTYVIEENQRVQNACQALIKGDLKTFGLNMYQSHEGLQHQYEVSCQELDFLVDQTRDDPAVLGSRMMGGGFGGCTINLVRMEETEKLTHRLTKSYHSRFGKKPEMYLVHIQDGGHIVSS